MSSSLVNTTFPFFFCYGKLLFSIPRLPKRTQSEINFASSHLLALSFIVLLVYVCKVVKLKKKTQISKRSKTTVENRLRKYLGYVIRELTFKKNRLKLGKNSFYEVCYQYLKGEFFAQPTKTEMVNKHNAQLIKNSARGFDLGST